MNTPTLETKRLILRKFTVHDMKALYSIYSDVEVNRFLPWFPIKSIEETKVLFEQKYAKAYEQPCGYRYAICLKSDNIPIGYINVSAEDSHDLGFGICKAFWHKGIVREACIAVKEQVEKDGLLYITATHDIHNPRSGNVMKAIGLRYQYSFEERWLPKDMFVIFRMYQLNFDDQNTHVYRVYWNKYPNHFVEIC